MFLKPFNAVGSIAPIINWPHCGDHEVASLRRSPNGSIAPIINNQRIGQRGQQDPELIRQPVHATGAICKQTKLLFLDPVFGLAPGAVNLIINRPGISGHIGHHKPRVGASRTVFGLDNDPSFKIPSFGGIRDLPKNALLLSSGLAKPFRSADQTVRLFQKPAVLGNANKIENAVLFTPVKHPVSAKTAVSSKNNPHLRPNLTKSFHQQRQDCPGVLCVVYVAGTKIRSQKMIAAKYIQRQKTVMIIITVKKPTHLLPVNRVVCAVKIQNQFFRSTIKGFNKNFHQRRAHIPEHALIRPVLKPAQSRWAGQGCVPIHGALKNRIASQGLMVVQIFVALGDRVNPLPKHIAQAVAATLFASRVNQAIDDALGQTEFSVRLPQQQNAAV
jgi:hypothetical protein